jgi:hypothetical protein
MVRATALPSCAPDRHDAAVDYHGNPRSPRGAGQPAPEWRCSSDSECGCVLVEVHMVASGCSMPAASTSAAGRV